MLKFGMFVWVSFNSMSNHWTQTAPTLNPNYRF